MKSSGFSATSQQHKMLTGTRGIAAMWVLLAHIIFIERYNAGFATKEYWGLLVGILRFDFLGVDFFFVLSGCMLYLAYREFFEQSASSKTIDRFYLQRLGRIYPIYLVGLVLMLVFYQLGILGSLIGERELLVFQHWQFWAVNFFLMNCWGILPAPSWNEPSWTVSAMAFVYILFPNIVLLLKKIPDTVFYNVLLMVVFLSVLATDRLLPNGLSSEAPRLLVRALCLFFCGCFCARLYTCGLGESWNWKAILSFLFVGGITLILLFFSIKEHVKLLYSSLVFLFVYPVFMLALLRGSGGAAVILTNPFSQFLGSISYSLYILHGPLLLLIKYYLGSTLSSIAAMSPLLTFFIYVAVVATLMAVSWVATKYIEVPAFRWTKNKLRSPQK